MRLSLISSKHCIIKQLLDSVFVIILLLIIIINFIYIASIPAFYNVRKNVSKL